AIPHSWHERAEHDRQASIERLHSPHERGRHRPFRSRADWCEGDRTAADGVSKIPARFAGQRLRTAIAEPCASDLGDDTAFSPLLAVTALAATSGHDKSADFR